MVPVALLPRRLFVELGKRPLLALCLASLALKFYELILECADQITEVRKDGGAERACLR